MRLEFSAGGKAPKLFYDGWKVVSELGYHPPVVEFSEPYLFHILAKSGRRHTGILSYYIDQAVEGNDAIIQMLYVKNQYRGNNIAGGLLKHFIESVCPRKGIKYVSATAHIDNFAANFLYQKFLTTSNYNTYQMELPECQKE